MSFALLTQTVAGRASAQRCKGCHVCTDGQRYHSLVVLQTGECRPTRKTSCRCDGLGVLNTNIDGA